MPVATTAELLIARVEDDTPGLLFEDQQWSWQEVVAEAAVRAAVLEELRPAEGPWHVGIAADNVPDYLFLVAGASLCGATIVGVNTTRRGAELAADVRGTDCAVVLVGQAQRGLFAGLDLGAAKILDLDGPAYAEMLARHADAPVSPPLPRSTRRPASFCCSRPARRGRPRRWSARRAGSR